ARLVRHDETEVVAWALAAQRRRDVGHELGVPRRVDDRPVVAGAGERAAPVDEQRAFRGRHGATLPRRRSSSREVHTNFTVSTQPPALGSATGVPPVTATSRGEW